MGGNSTTETNISLTALAAKQQSIVGIPQGNLNQLIELLNAVADKQVRYFIVLIMNHSFTEGLGGGGSLQFI